MHHLFTVRARVRLAVFGNVIVLVSALTALPVVSLTAEASPDFNNDCTVSPAEIQALSHG